MNTVQYENYKEKLRELLLNMESSPAAEGMPMLDCFVKDYEESLYNEIGKLTRQLHDSLTTFDSEERILNLASEDIPGAKERLRYVVSMTEQATQNVLDVVEKSIPISLEISAKAGELHDACAKIAGVDGADAKDDLPNLLRDITRFLADAKGSSGILHGHLTEILMAQEFQDITGQIIRKVIDLVQEVEDSLVELIRMTGRKPAPTKEERSNSKLNGPNVPGIDDQSDNVTGQDDVDHLLASLGF